MLDVHTNGPLTIIPKFFEKLKWNDYKIPVYSNACSLLQIAALYENFIGVSEDEIRHRLNSFSVDPLCDYKGPTLQEAFSILRRDEDPKSPVGMIDYTDHVDDAIDSVCSGIPIMLIMDCDSYCERGESLVVNHPSESTMRYNHCYLIVGYDRETKEFILRDSRSRYSLNGYIKISRSNFVPHHKFYRFFQIAFNNIQ